jgi:pyruvate dehydrogenase E2 component (dihydrolipoamide acetyltransferase)
MGIPDDRFGSVMISNFGPLGIENALVPLSPYCRCPVIMGIGAPKKKAVVVGDEVVVRKCVTISFTFDHRYADGAHGAVLLHRFEKMFLNPEQYRNIFLPGTTSDTTESE